MSYLCPTPVNGHEIDCTFVTLGYFKVILLGIIQGITELLPISSTAHLRIIPSLLGWEDPGTAFSGAAQLASFFAVILYFRKEILNIIHGFLTAIKTKNFNTAHAKLGLGTIIATIPIAIAGLSIKSILNQSNSPLRSLYVVSISCIIMGTLLIFTEKFAKHKKDLNSFSIRDSIIIGIAQAFALIPGVSRSGSTLTVTLFLGYKRKTAAAISFLLGVPVIVLAGLKEIHEFYQAHLPMNGWLVLGSSLIAASISAFLAVFCLMKYLENRTTYPFAGYRILLGIFLFLGAYLGFLK